MLTMNENRLSATLNQTIQLHRAVAAHIGSLVPAEGERFAVSLQAGLLSIEHSMGAVMLIDSGLYASGFSLLRPQYESLVRGVWLLYAASENWVAKLSAPLTEENARRANEGLMLADMLKELDTSDAPTFLLEQVNKFRDVAWKALNSYAHGGLHPLARTASGYPPQLTIDVLKNSNGLTCIAAQLASVLSGDPENMQPVRQLHIDFADCIPIA
ncbi:DUF6988 family protein [Burkholderia cepacia]|uniref:DUF6988 family protein n=1 Tax=Burkholderia cepacia TaxID=292 RepID=UPI001FC7F972|nr:hypothetical protein [Burkholderia cepacia]